ncbi:unnamed protein product [Protopolystoma xenopodis]|uniref:Uncharacterized protein n=1 Tax=Protopolystoma xenopodis TaxID=117903 RepID=A0A448WEH3_9PLAT|nr:unnamed protein product [Protopolystoma xenopodis]
MTLRSLVNSAMHQHSCPFVSRIRSIPTSRVSHDGTARQFAAAQPYLNEAVLIFPRFCRPPSRSWRRFEDTLTLGAAFGRPDLRASSIEATHNRLLSRPIVSLFTHVGKRRFRFDVSRLSVLPEKETASAEVAVGDFND